MRIHDGGGKSAPLKELEIQVENVRDVIYAIVTSVVAQKGWLEKLFFHWKTKMTFIIQMVHNSQQQRNLL